MATWKVVDRQGNPFKVEADSIHDVGEWIVFKSGARVAARFSAAMVYCVIELAAAQAQESPKGLVGADGGEVTVVDYVFTPGNAANLARKLLETALHPYSAKELGCLLCDRMRSPFSGRAVTADPVVTANTVAAYASTKMRGHELLREHAGMIGLYEWPDEPFEEAAKKQN